MMMRIDEFQNQLRRSENLGIPSHFFENFHETELWPLIMAVLSQEDQEGFYYPLTIMRGLENFYKKAQDKKSADEAILFVLEESKDDLIFSAAEEVLLFNAKEFDEMFAKKIHRILEMRYLNAMSSKNEFIANKALEGAVMFPLFRGNDGLLLRSIGLLISEFPEIPDDPTDPAYLPVKAIKLLGRCFDKRPDNQEIYFKIESLLGFENHAVKSEANLGIGVVYLYESFKAREVDEFQINLQKANEYFIKSLEYENRTDASFYSAIVSFFLSIMTGVVKDLSQYINLAREYLYERLMLIGSSSHSVSSVAVEEKLSRLIFFLEDWRETISQAPYWPNITPQLSKLAELYTSVRELDAYDDLAKAAANSSFDLVMLPTIKSQLIQVQNITSKIVEVLNDKEWRSLASPSEIEFYEMLVSELSKVSSPKELAAVDLSKIRTAASKANPWIANQIDKQIDEGKSIEDILLGIIDNNQEEQILGKWGNSAYQASNDVVEKLQKSLSSLLNWNLDEERNRIRWLSLKNAIKASANFFHQLYIADSSPETSFLFAVPNGKGINATEKDLEDFFYKNVRWWQDGVKVEKQPRDITPGRPDLVFRGINDFIFPIEVKKEEKDISRENIRQSYIAQAQTYASSQSQISFLFVLDVTKKQVGTPLSDQLNFCYVDHGLAGGEVLDYVVVFIFPANRLSPSDHSWNRKKLN